MKDYERHESIERAEDKMEDLQKENAELKEKLKAFEWRPIETAPKNRAVLIFYRNSYDQIRIVKAKYIEKFTEVASGDYEDPEYDEKTDEYYYPQGWWELIDNWGDYSMVFISGHQISHWMPLPNPPIEGKIGFGPVDRKEIERPFTVMTAKE